MSWRNLPSVVWQATRDTVHMWTRVVAKARLAPTPRLNHWSNSTLYHSTWPDNLAHALRRNEDRV
jgi:Family of unknown function (DUF5996)